jgi:hypothetical protein
MRTDQYIGLNERGKKFVEGLRAEILCKFEGAFYNKFYLYAYYADNEEFMSIEPTCIEFIQEAPWSSGPMYFIALTTIRGTQVEESLWTEEEIEARI